MEDWLNNPILKDVDSKKLELLMEIFVKSKKLSTKELIPYFIAASTKAASNGISFSDEETDLILSVLKERMSPKDISKIDTIKKLSKMIAKRSS